MRIVIVLCALPGYCMLSVILSLCAQRCCGASGGVQDGARCKLCCSDNPKLGLFVAGP